MLEKTKITLDDLYRSLKVHDKEILKRFDDKTLDDQQYLFYAINFDIISNALSLVIAIETDNLDCFGVDNSCRTIIEAFVVLRMIAAGDISDEQAKIFRYHYAIVDYTNMYKFIDDKLRLHEDFKYVEKDREAAYKAILSLHNCTKSDLKKDPDLDNSNFYLKKKLGGKLRFSVLLKQYPIFDVCDSKMYDFFSLFIHPRYEFDFKIEESLRNVRTEYVNRVLDYVVSYMSETKLFVLDESLNTFKQDFYENPILKNNVLNINVMNRVFESIKKKTCYFSEGYDAFSMFFLDRMREVITDMQVSISLGYKEHIISLFKSTIEYIAVYSLINECETVEKFKKMKLAYCYSSRLQINALLGGLGLPAIFGEETIGGLRQLFDDYYKEQYSIDNFDLFVKNVTNNARYFLNKDNNSFNNIVNKLLDDLYPNPQEREFTRLIYRISKDMNHGGGYAFNSSPGLIDSQCRHVQNAIYRYMLYYLNESERTLKENGINVDLTFEKKTFELLAAAEETEIEKVKKEYSNKK